MMQMNTPHADDTGPAALWTRLGLSLALWVYVGAAAFVWAHGWQLWLALITSTAAVAAIACVAASLYFELSIIAGMAFWVVAVFTGDDQHPARTLLAWIAVSLVFAIVAAAMVLRRRPALLSGSLPAGGWPPPSGPRRAPDSHQPPGRPDSGLEPSSVPALPLVPAPALHAGAEADPDED